MSCLDQGPAADWSPGPPGSGFLPLLSCLSSHSDCGLFCLYCHIFFPSLSSTVSVSLLFFLPSFSCDLHPLLTLKAALIGALSAQNLGPGPPPHPAAPVEIDPGQRIGSQLSQLQAAASSLVGALWARHSLGASHSFWAAFRLF